MEHHRLKPMEEGYDKDLFESLFRKTTPLMRKLAYQIDARKFGVDYQEILSWFHVKFIHAFNKYHKKESERLLGYIINSLTTYKYRVMRSSYQVKYHNHANMLDVTELYDYKGLIDTTSSEATIRETYMNKVMDFMKTQLTDDGMLILEIQLNPPPYIIEQMKDMDKADNATIPHTLIAEYIGLGTSQPIIEYIKDLRRDIKDGILGAKEFFTANPLQLQLS